MRVALNMDLHTFLRSSLYPFSFTLCLREPWTARHVFESISFGKATEQLRTVNTVSRQHTVVSCVLRK